MGNFEKYKSCLKVNWLYICMVTLVIIKISILGGIPLYARSEQTYDDYLMVKHATSMINGEWLGVYNSLTLTKGIFFPAFLAVSYLFNINFQIAQILFHAGACISFIYVSNKFIKNKGYCLLFFVLLLFDPITSSTDTFLMVYRCNLLPSEVLYLISFFMGMYVLLQENNNKIKYFSICSGIGLSLIWNTREDSIWVLPMLFVLLSFSLSSCKQKKMKYSLYFIVPFIMLFCFNQAICFMNYINYNTYNRTELSGGNFPRMMKAIYAIEPDEFIERVSVPHSSFEKLYKISKSFAELKPFFDDHYDIADAADTKVDGHIRDGWFFWLLRDAINQKSKTAPQAEAFYGRIADEIEDAFVAGTLERSKNISMPSALMSPYRESYFKETFWAMCDAVEYIINYQDIQMQLKDSTGDKSKIREFEMITLSSTYQPKYYLQISGWIYSKYNTDTLHLVTKNINGIEKNIEFFDAADIYETFIKENKNYQNVFYGRFFINEVFEDRVNVPNRLILSENKNNIRDFTIDNHIKNFFDDERFAMNIENFSLQKNDIIVSNITKKKIALVNCIHNIYKAIIKPMLAISVITYIILMIALMIQYYKKIGLEFFYEWLLLTMVLIGFCTLLSGVAYTHISAFGAISTIYLAPAYPLVLIFIMISFSVIFKNIKSMIVNKKLFYQVK